MGKPFLLLVGILHGLSVHFPTGEDLLFNCGTSL